MTDPYRGTNLDDVRRAQVTNSERSESAYADAHCGLPASSNTAAVMATTPVLMVGSQCESTVTQWSSVIPISVKSY